MADVARLQILEQELRKKDDIIRDLKDHIQGLESGRRDVASASGKSSRLERSETVSAGSPTATTDTRNVPLTALKRHSKSSKSKEIIKDALKDNDLLSYLEPDSVGEIVEVMHEEVIETSDAVLYNQGENAEKMYVIEEGEFEMIIDGEVKGRVGQSKLIGVSGVLYNCTRAEGVKAVSPGKLWVIDRAGFQTIMMKTGVLVQEEHMDFLRSVPVLKDIPDDQLSKVAGLLDEQYYEEGEYIIRQGARGDTFFILKKGTVDITQRASIHSDPQFVRSLGKGAYFGEKALLGEDERTANVIAGKGGCACLVVDRERFSLFTGDLNSQEYEKGEARRKGRDRRTKDPESSAREKAEAAEFAAVELPGLKVVATLGVGSFGRVELVQHSSNPKVSYALKKIAKHRVVEMREQEHVLNEKSTLAEVKSSSIVRLYKTFRDDRYVYLLMEACLGGEIFTILRDRGSFDDSTTRFYAGCVVEAIEFLHERGIVHRHITAENVVLDDKGYAKLTDFGFAKKIGFSRKTYTLCGSPEYTAPEIILNQGHDISVDLWSLGIFMYELLVGKPPVSGSTPLKTYELVLHFAEMYDFPRKVTRNARNLIKKLCRRDPSDRLGYSSEGIGGIQKHKWFDGFNWDGLRNRKLQPPIVPKVRSPTDTSNFDDFPKDDTAPPEDVTGWDKDF